MNQRCRWCRKLLDSIAASTPFGCAFNDPKTKGFCSSSSCLDAWCDRDDRRKQERSDRRRY